MRVALGPLRCCLPMATRILIADDHEMMRAVLRNMINSHDGWEVCAEARNGSEAVARVKELCPDLIILDLGMPIMDGMQAAREINKRDPEARMIMFTLHASPEVEEQARRVGVRRVVSKAKNGGRLLSAIEQTLANNREESAGETATDFAANNMKLKPEIRVYQAGASRSNDGRSESAASGSSGRSVSERPEATDGTKKKPASGSTSPRE